jgi:hypothetical protein
MKTFRFVAGLLGVLCLAGVLLAAGVDIAAMQKVSDAFMDALIANKPEEAVGLLDPEYVKKVGRAGAAERIMKFFDYCGRPLEREYKQSEAGVQNYPDGRRSPSRKFYYRPATDQHPKGNCWFTITVVPNPAGPRVTEYGAIKVQAGDYI